MKIVSLGSVFIWAIFCSKYLFFLHSPIHNPFAAGVPDYSAYSGVPEWLESLKMSRYSDHFAKAGVLTMESVAKLSLPQLVEIGVTLVGHQKKIMGSIHAMRAQMSVNMSEGFLV